MAKAKKKNPEELTEDLASEYVFQIVEEFGYRWLLEEVAGDADSSDHDELKEAIDKILDTAEKADDEEGEEVGEGDDDDEIPEED